MEPALLHVHNVDFAMSSTHTKRRSRRGRTRLDEQVEWHVTTQEGGSKLTNRLERREINVHVFKIGIWHYIGRINQIREGRERNNSNHQGGSCPWQSLHPLGNLEVIGRRKKDRCMSGKGASESESREDHFTERHARMTLHPMAASHLAVSKPMLWSA